MVETVLRILLGWTVLSGVAVAGWAVLVTGFRQAKRREQRRSHLERLPTARTRRAA